jgi:hypothetical protein
MLHTIKAYLKIHRLSLLVLIASFSILNLRTLHSIVRFPADPGYDYLFSGATNGIQSWFDLDPYVHFGAHFLSWLASFAPLENQAIVLATFVHFAWSLLAVAILVVLNREGFSEFVSLLSALTLVLCPAASESSLANVGNIKWPLLIFALILVSSNQLKHSPKLSGAYLFLTGITNPLMAVVFLPLLMNFFGTDKTDRKTFLIPTMGMLTSFGIQAITVGSSGLSRGTGGIKVLAPWPGMGMFWWFGLISPTIICLITLLVNPLIHVHMKSTLITRIAVVAPVLALGSYLYGGIGDRYFVAPMVISWIVSLVLINELGSRLKRSQFMAISVATLLIFLIPTIKWFNSSWYLTAGSTWSEEVNLARIICSSGPNSVQLNIGGISTTELSCAYIKHN